ncbi:Glyoxylase, beta-lactamase superfamily II [Catalinimonas alkaloidigena]|uniref:Glyoxylase, beta-lactamase superfamily II n=1 Tax=Catalinimonas alkaloidigena TaxID=1075417 RepID=A0A1G9M2I4_9BACT|nr:MBL fold metallo-hydrolase [Catalinimonas alkaloidigena]SDL68147.1 Glyoxylase, beta-lactamase superfamily II [Catalinimonas alkaloidigena]
MQLQRFTFNPFQENTYVLYDTTGECIVVDPGCSTPQEEQRLTNFIAQQQLKVVRLVNTHGHVDHVLGNYFVHSHYKVDLGTHHLDEQTLRSVKVYAPSYGFTGYTEVLPAYHLEENTTLTFGESSLEIRFVPGHAPGHIVFYSAADGFCVAGDTLFRESIGRTDLPGGDHQTLLNSIRSDLFSLPDETVVYPGHGPETTIGHEKKYNPFCRLPLA